MKCSRKRKVVGKVLSVCISLCLCSQPVLIPVHAQGAEGIEQNGIGKEESGLLFREEQIEVTDSGPVSLTAKDYAEDLKNLEEGTFVIQFESVSTEGVQSLISIGNNTVNDNHFHVYMQPTGSIGFELRNGSGFSYSGANYRVSSGVHQTYKGQPAINTVAWKADKESGSYKVFANGNLVLEIDGSTLSNGYKSIKDISGLNNVTLGGTYRGGNPAYRFKGTINYVEGYDRPLPDEKLEELTASGYQGKNIFHANDATQSNYFRIPTLLTLQSGTVVASIDARFGGTEDCPNNIDIAFNKSTDGGETWGEATMPLHFDDFKDTKLKLPDNSRLKSGEGACFIDSQMLEGIDEEGNARLFLMADAYRSGQGGLTGESKSGYTVINGKKYLMLQKSGESGFGYTVREGGVIYNNATGQPTEYQVNENYEIMKDGVLLTLKQKDVRLEGGEVVSFVTDDDVPMNIMYDGAVFEAMDTTYTFMKYSDDEGETWSATIIMNEMVKEEGMKFLGTGPGHGIQIKNGAYKGRLLFNMYENTPNSPKQNTCRAIYSDDFGESWKLGNYVNRGSMASMTESQTIELPDGSLRLFARTTSGKIAQATSIDGGVNWTAGELVDELTLAGNSGCLVSAVNYNGLIDGKPAILLSAPVITGRKYGKIKIGLIEDTGRTGSDRYEIIWKYERDMGTVEEYFAYSCLTQLPNGDIGIHYEKANTKQTINSVLFETYTLSELKGRETAQIEVAADPERGSAEGGGNVNIGETAVVTAIPKEGYLFRDWTDESGNVVSAEEHYTFTAEESVVLTANFVKDATCTCGIANLKFDNQNIIIPRGQESCEVVLKASADLIGNCEVEEHSGSSISYTYELVDSDGAAGTIHGDRLTVTKEGTLRVKATAVVNDLTLSAEALVRVEKETVQEPIIKPLEQPAGLKGTKHKTKSIKISWNKVSGADGYLVFRYDAKTKKWSERKNLTASGFTDRALKLGTVYKYKIKAYRKDANGIQESSFSKVLTTATQPAKPVLTVKNLGKGKVKLTWKKKTNADKFEIYQKTGNRKFRIYTTRPGKSTSCTISKLKKGKRYAFKVKGYKKAGNSKVYSAFSKIKKVLIK